MAVEKKVRTTETFNGIAFRNFPAEEYMNDLSFSMRDEMLAEQIAQIITEHVPLEFRAGIEVDCTKIDAFNQEQEPYGEPSEAELRILEWLDGLNEMSTAQQHN